MKKWVKRYRGFLILVLVNILLGLFAPEIGKASVEKELSNVKTMLGLIPPVFVLLGLLDVWVDRATLMKYMGEGSGVRGTLLSFVMGSAAAGPLYAAFPVAAVLIKKGASLFNVFVFVGTWSCAKVPMLIFEATSLGPKFMVFRLMCNIAGILGIACILAKTTDDETQKEIEENAEKMSV